MSKKNKAHRILWYECVGFTIVILVSWADELFRLPQRFFGGPRQGSNWREAAMESIVTLFVWLAVSLLTQKILRRLHYLEGMVNMCAWCRKLEQEGKWVSFEEYIVRDFQTTTSHGMCQSCESKMLGEMPRRDAIRSPRMR